LPKLRLGHKGVPKQELGNEIKNGLLKIEKISK
jgi:hypothetical protein